MNIISSLQWRYATKKMTGDKVSSEKLDIILHATQLAASSYGLQPYTILVINNEEVKKQLSPAAYNQPQIVQSSHLLVFCVWTDITEAQVTTYINDIATKRNISEDSLAGFKDAILGTINGLNVDQKQTWAAKQAYIALGTTLVAAAVEEVDATPMEGFNAAQFDAILG
ncbi:MAG: nitroreductase family protein, partial [Deinococcales bacterium]|nr:nitroreductase family protein [Chitinophagaceae bacterium]